MSDGFLHKYFLNHSGRVIHKWFHYFDVYEKHFERFRGKNINFLEIGVGQGGSQQMWRAYFGPEANIMCLDIRDLSHRIDPKVAKFYQGDQTDPDILNRIIAENGTLDIVLDDGSHFSKHIIPTFNILYPRMNPTGVYMVEDVSCVYKKRYNGGLKQEGSFIEFTKDLIDNMNFAHLKQFKKDDAFGNSTHSINVYDSMVVFERRPKAHLQWARTGKQGSLGETPFTPNWPQLSDPEDVVPVEQALEPLKKRTKVPTGK
jgi:23S rRNA U2552 (ribose-2'-O)-methylase RlmE/FtsJ